MSSDKGMGNGACIFEDPINIGIIAGGENSAHLAMELSMAHINCRSMKTFSRQQPVSSPLKNNYINFVSGRVLTPAGCTNW